VTIKYQFKRWLLLLGDLVCVVAVTLIASRIRFGEAIYVIDQHTGGSVFTLIVYFGAMYIFDLYNVERSFRSRQDMIRVLVAFGCAGVVLVLFYYSVPNWRYGRGIFGLNLILAVLSLYGWRVLFGLLFLNAPIKEKVLVLGAGISGLQLLELLERRSGPYEVVGFLDDDEDKIGTWVGSVPVVGPCRHLLSIARRMGVESAVLAVPHQRSAELIDAVLEARLQGLVIQDMTNLFESLKGCVAVEYVRKEWFIFANGFYLISKQYIRRIKRLIDFCVAGLLLLLAAPLMLLTALAIRIDSKGPAFYRQNRVGFRGTVFPIFKFRSMRVDAEQNGAVWASEDDPRVTRVGRFIRTTRIDELPQLINVFRGDMSLIGPRPERPEFIKELEAQIPFYAIRHFVRPGITGWAQVNYPYGASVKDALEKLGYDLYYIKNMSLLLDVIILLRTVGVILIGQGAR
jgi:sugar transferase (PEP-CTERM system associated)